MIQFLYEPHILNIDKFRWLVNGKISALYLTLNYVQFESMGKNKA